MSFNMNMTGHGYAPGWFLAREECERKTRQISKDSANGGVGAIGVYTITIDAKAASGDKITVNGVTIEAGSADWPLTTDTADGNATAITATLNASTEKAVASYTWTSTGAVITATEKEKGVGGALAVTATQTTSGTLSVSTEVVTAGEAPTPAKYVKMGTIYPANDSTAEGIIYEDVDVTSGDMPGSVVLSGTVYKDRLHETLDASAQTALESAGFKFVDTAPTVTRP